LIKGINLAGDGIPMLPS